MSITIKLKRGTSASCNSYTGSAGELVYDTTNNILRLHNGTKAGGYQLWNSDTIDGRYLKLTGGTLNGGLLVGPNGSDSEGGQIGLKPGTDSDYGVWIDTTAGNFRVFGMTNPGSVFMVNPQTDVISYNGKHLIRSINGNTADANGNITSVQTGCLPLTGETMTGTIRTTARDGLAAPDDTTEVRVCGGTGLDDGASFIAYGRNSIHGSGGFRVRATTDENAVCDLVGTPDGSLSWGGKHVVRSVNSTNADANGNVSLSLNYLPLTGGELSGPLKFTKTGETTTIIRGSSDDSEFDMYGGASGGARIALNGINRTNYAGQFIISANTSDQTSTLHGYPNGTLHWNGKNIALKEECLQLSGGRMTGALNYANNTWNLLGDDVYFGDHNIGGGFCLKGANNTTKLVFYKQDESAQAQINYDGNFTMSATTYAPSFQISSDRRLKSNIKPIEDGLEKVTQLTGCTFDKIGIDHNTAGLIAQEVESILPQAVSNNADGYKSIDYSAVVGLLVQAIKQLNQKVEQLESQSLVTE